MTTIQACTFAEALGDFMQRNGATFADVLGALAQRASEAADTCREHGHEVAEARADRMTVYLLKAEFEFREGRI